MADFQKLLQVTHVTSPLTPQRTGAQRAVADGALNRPIMPCGADVAVLSCGVVLTSLNTMTSASQAAASVVYYQISGRVPHQTFARVKVTWQACGCLHWQGTQGRNARTLSALISSSDNGLTVIARSTLLEQRAWWVKHQSLKHCVNKHNSTGSDAYEDASQLSNFIYILHMIFYYDKFYIIHF